MTIFFASARPVGPTSATAASDRGDGTFVAFDPEIWLELATILAADPGEPLDLDVLIAVLDRDSVVAFGPLLSRYGVRATRTVPALRMILRDARRSVDDEGAGIAGDEAAIRALVGIGAPARETIPDIRLWMAFTGDPHGVGRAAVQALERL